MNDRKIMFATRQEWEAWLGTHGTSVAGVWLRIAKKSAQQPTLTYAQALEAALCHGWIDGRKQAESEHYWLQRFTPRAGKSLWSKINRTRAEALMSAGRMQPAGLREVDRARQDGRWDAAYASASMATVPDDLQEALDGNPAAARFFATLDGRNRYAVLFRVQNAKRAETRARKITQFVEMLSRGEKIHP
jgi:uncharacterized protein YdeI (YjbR/CyaY-like superfamily)